MIPTIKSPDAARAVVRLDELAKLAPQRRKKALGIIIREQERRAKRIACSGGVFSRRSKGILARSLRGRVLSTTGAALTVGTAYGIIQDHGGTTPPHEIRPRFKKALAFPSGSGGFSNAARIGRGKIGSILSPRFARAHAAGKVVTGMTVVRSVQHPGSRIPATHYSWKAWLATRDYAHEQTRLAMLGKATR